MALYDTNKKKPQPIGFGTVNASQVNFDNPIPGQITADTFQQPAPANLQPKPRAHPLGGFSNPKADRRTPGAVPPIGGVKPLASHEPGAGSVSAENVERMRKPLQIASPSVPAIDAEPKRGGTVSKEGGGDASIDSQGNIDRGPGWEKGAGTLNVVPGGSEAVPPIGGDKWSFLEDGSALGAARAGIARKLGYVPADYDRNHEKYDAAVAAQGAQYAQAENTLPIAEIGADSQRYVADQGLAGHQMAADATVKAAEIGAEGRLAETRRKIAEDGTKDAKEMQKTFYDSIKDLNLPAGYEGKHMELAKILAQDQDPNVDLGIYYAPGQTRQGIAAKKSVFDPLLEKYRRAGYPEADAHAHAYAELLEMEKQGGASYHRPFPNLDRLYKNDRKKPVELLAAAG